MTNKTKRPVRKLLFSILIFDALMRITPPLSIFALSVAAAAAYKVSPNRAKDTFKSTISDIRTQLSDWIKPNEDDPEGWSINRDNPDYGMNTDTDVDVDDKSYPPETV